MSYLLEIELRKEFEEGIRIAKQHKIIPRKN